MPNYKLSKEARNDLTRIQQYGVRKFGEAQADNYFNQFFELIAERPLAFESVEFIKPDTEGVYAVLTVFSTEPKKIMSKSWQLLVDRIFP